MLERVVSLDGVTARLTAQQLQRMDFHANRNP